MFILLETDAHLPVMKSEQESLEARTKDTWFLFIWNYNSWTLQLNTYIITNEKFLLLFSTIYIVQTTQNAVIF